MNGGHEIPENRMGKKPTAAVTAVHETLQVYVEQQTDEGLQENLQEQVRFLVEDLIALAPDPAAVERAVYAAHTVESDLRSSDELAYAKTKLTRMSDLETLRAKDLLALPVPQEVSEDDLEPGVNHDTWQYRSFSAANRAATMWWTVAEAARRKRATNQVVDITPGLAQQMLLNDFAAREVPPEDEARQMSRFKDQVSAYAQAMRDGKWVLSSTPISVTPGGRILDGTIRLMAVLESGVSSRFTIQEMPE